MTERRCNEQSSVKAPWVVRLDLITPRQAWSKDQRHMMTLFRGVWFPCFSVAVVGVDFVAGVKLFGAKASRRGMLLSEICR